MSIHLLARCIYVCCSHSYLIQKVFFDDVIIILVFPLLCTIQPQTQQFNSLSLLPCLTNATGIVSQYVISLVC